MEEKYERLKAIAQRMANGLQNVDISLVPTDAEQAVEDFEHLLREDGDWDSSESWSDSGCSF